jgi:mannose-1-phosphate guanylyltransferase
MKAILLSAGFGKRLGSLTKNKPKCLLKVNNKAILEIWLEKLFSNNVKEVLINSHYLSDQIKVFVDQSKYKKKIKLVYERKLLGTAGTLLKNINFFNNQDGLLIHADNYIEEDIENFVTFYKKNKMPLSLMAFKTSNFRDCGILKINKNNTVINIYEKKNISHGKYANGAIYILSKEAQAEIKKKFFKKKDFAKDILPNFLGRISAFKTKKIFVDIGNIERYIRLNLLLSRRKNIK